MTAPQGDGMLGLEKELTCSICTDLLYQPLTLLDCLHTFCGSCLREWFAWQAYNATSSTPYTCPSCRSPVRGTRPNATVTTLLDLYLGSHPEKSKTGKERAEIELSYKPGDNVTPPVHVQEGSSDSENERMLADAREMSLQDMDPERARRTRNDRAARHDRHRRRDAERTSRTAYLGTRAEELDREQQASTPLPQGRPLEHQSSLRSILSASDINSQEMEAEIMQQIVDEGLLDGIDLNSLTPTQEEEITERIAQAFRRRQQQGRSSRVHTRRSTDRLPNTVSAPVATTRHHGHARSESGSNQPSHPPISRPHLLGAPADDSRRRQDRSSSRASQNSNRSARAPESSPNNPYYPRATSRSSTDLSDRPRSSAREGTSRPSTSERTFTDPEAHASVARSHRGRAASSEQSLVPGPQTARRRSRSSSRASTHHNITSLRSTLGPSNNSSSPALLSQPLLPEQRSAPRPTSSSGAESTARAPVVTAHAIAPAIACSRCNRSDIQHSLHYNCSRCYQGAFNLCLSCYRSGAGCLKWYGFGHAASYRFEKAVAEGQTTEDSPHILTARRFQEENDEHIRAQDRISSPSGLEQGVFCEGCFAFADACYWHCDICLDGAWGYCDACVRTGKHCTHALQPFALISAQEPSHQDAHMDIHAALWKHDQPTYPSTILPNVQNPASYRAISTQSSCTICRRTMASTSARYHCYTCNDGDYEICQSCYSDLTRTGKIRLEDGAQGWRRCLHGHRMAVVGYESKAGGDGRARIVVKEIVGGWALKESDGGNGSGGSNDSDRAGVAPDGTSSIDRNGQWQWREVDGSKATLASTFTTTTASIMDQQRQPAFPGSYQKRQPQQVGDGSTLLLPPSGGTGLRVLALWSYWAAEGVRDELSFPRNAEIREVEDVNGDWFWGVYAGRKGLFPGNYGRRLE